ncbi:hypothetical protein FE257_008106 [Aspergillus nanangensis]|uniref:Xylanolytic transcriptional activator regulatory domain-containing protein n=1 Tax=Aspergillus nanangensis TaxID=2582783 RepID=A0AAD4CM95_ASPNN|nr:hypothetical protein FE257_008106 [Aspergillus nanangensis]
MLGRQNKGAVDAHLLTKQYIDHYFQSFHPYWCFIHKGSFDMENETPLLVQSMTVIGLWASGEHSAQTSAVELHHRLGLAIQDQKEKWDASEVDGVCSACHWPIATYQAILLHIIFSSLLKGRDGVDFRLKPSLDAADSGLLKALVQSCRRLGLFYYPNMLARYTEADLDSFAWASIEEVKRFNLALYKVCGKVTIAGEGDRSKVDDDALSLLSTSELQFPLPDNLPLWNAVGKSEWAANTKDERLVFLNDNCEAKWISNFAAILDFLDL